MRAKIKDGWKYFYKKKECNTIDLLLTSRRQKMSAESFLIKAIENNGKP